MTSLNTDRIGGNLIPEGIHNFVVSEFEEKTGPKGEYWNFTCKVINSPFEGQQCWVVISLSPQSRWKAEQWLDCFEIPEGMEVDGEDFVGLAFRGKVIHEEGNDGKTRAKIDEFLPAQKVKLNKSAAVVKKGKKAAPVQEDEDEGEGEDEEDTGEEADAEEAEETGEDEEASEEDTDTEAEDEDDAEEEEQQQRPVKKAVKKPIKAAAKPFPVKKPAGKLPQPKSKFKRPF